MSAALAGIALGRDSAFGIPPSGPAAAAAAAGRPAGWADNRRMEWARMFPSRLP